MICSMDLNVSPLPEEDEDTFASQFEEREAVPRVHIPHADHIESAVAIANREREERRRRLKQERGDDRQVKPRREPVHDYHTHQQNHRTYDRTKLPPGWLDCPPYGQDICEIIPSKVPLSDAFNENVAPGKRYSFRQVMRNVRVMGKHLGLVIDLTNTTRYYSPDEWKKDGIKHVKIQCKGRGSVPDNEAVNAFFCEVSQFLIRQKQNNNAKQPKKCALVHCTHGHNRTGYMIVHYLMRTSAMPVTQAIKIFADARPPGIYKEDYIDALYTFYHERKPEIVVCPPTPEWKRSSELDLNGDALPDDDDDGNSTVPILENHVPNVVMTNDDILGDSIPFDQQDAYRQFCYHALKLTSGPRGNAQFPGSHPVSFSRENQQLLRQRYYYATWKADGTRYMMLITVDGCYLIDRNFNFRRVQMRFPCRIHGEGAPERHHHYTLLDGEMVIDLLPDSQKQERRYLIYDLMAINQVSIIERPFHERWKMLEREVIEPRNLERIENRNSYYRYEMEPFRVRRKAFWLLPTVNKLLGGFIPSLSHDADGLIFQGWDDPYIPRTHEGLLKWKYANMNSVDYLFEMVDSKQQLYLFERGKKKLMDGSRVVFSEGDPESYAGKIVECSYNAEEDVWVCMRIRTDKATPNEFRTYRKVMQSIKDNITEDILLSEIEEIVQLPMYADRIKADTKSHHKMRR
ncbi:mRNA-capping enzyme-like isoform X2 [Impatiens glandulifera]|uniref:mRNA-capping enzyme-like isoform X2 n=1 Tax=Impatiens glandulifera TaxID=253017 RepID=UPI001FB110CE|nr:mRNA-capping enzyme-like isoform X2 [Impatiens glandulifera]